MPSNPIQLPPKVAKAFVGDMRVFLDAALTPSKPTRSAAQQLHALKQHFSGKFPLAEVKEMFVRMRDRV
jgi:hypothetical protein